MSAAAAAILVVLGATPRFSVSEIEPRGEMHGHWTADVDGDGLVDILVGTWSAATGRELQIHLQQSNGTFRPAPDRRVDIKRDIIAFATADVRDEPGDELVLFTRTGCFSLSTAKKGYAGNVKRLFSQELIAAVPHRKTVRLMGLVRDLDGDGATEIFAPSSDAHIFWGARDGGRFAQRGRMPLASDTTSFSAREEHRLEISLRDGFAHSRSNAFTGLVTEWESVSGEKTRGGRRGRGRGGRLLDESHWAPAPAVVDLDGDGKLDVIVLEEVDGSSLLRAHLQRDSGEFPEAPDWSATLAHDGGVWPIELDGDGKTDLMVESDTARGSLTIRLHLNRDGRFDVESADQVMKFSGHGIEPRVVDLDGDSRPELVISSYSISTLGTIRDGSVVRTLLVYRSDDDAVFERRPTFKLDEKFSAREFKGLGARIELGADVDGSGRRDALLIDRDGAVVARAIDESFQIADEPFWRFVPRRTVLELNVARLNDDARADLILGHIRSLTVLVSR